MQRLNQLIIKGQWWCFVTLGSNPRASSKLNCLHHFFKKVIIIKLMRKTGTNGDHHKSIFYTFRPILSSTINWLVLVFFILKKILSLGTLLVNITSSENKNILLSKDVNNSIKRPCETHQKIFNNQQKILKIDFFLLGTLLYLSMSIQKR